MDKTEGKYGYCSFCGSALKPVWFKLYETDRYGCRTGRWKMAVDALVCGGCLKEETVDDSFDGDWH